MTLKLVLDSLDGVDEAQHSLYKEVDGKFILDVAGIDEHPDVAALRRSHQRSKEERTQAKKELENLQSEFDKFKDLDPEKAREALAKAQELEDKELIDAGKVDELVDKKVERMRADFDAQLKAKDEAIEQLTGERDSVVHELSDVKIFTAVKDAALAKGAKKTALDDIVNRAKPVWRLVDGKPVAIKVGTDDEVMYGKEGDPLTITEWVDGLAGDATHLFEPNKGGGAGGGAGPGVGIDVKIIDPTQAGDHIADIAAGKVQLSE